MVIYGPLDAPADISPQDQEQQEENQNQNDLSFSYSGPNLRVKNGEVIWSGYSSNQPQNTEPTGAGTENSQENDVAPQDDTTSGVEPVQTVPNPEPDDTGNQSGQTNKPSAQTSNSGASVNETDSPKSSETALSNPSSGLSSSNKGGGNWGEDSTTNEITGSLFKTAYWVNSGKSYHFTQDCPSLSRSTNIKSGTLQDALNAGKTDPCNNCAGGS